MHKVLLLSELRELVGGEVGAAVRDQELELVWEQGAERGEAALLLPPRAARPPLTAT